MVLNSSGSATLTTPSSLPTRDLSCALSLARLGSAGPNMASDLSAAVCGVPWERGGGAARQGGGASRPRGSDASLARSCGLGVRGRRRATDWARQRLAIRARRSGYARVVGPGPRFRRRRRRLQTRPACHAAGGGRRQAGCCGASGPGPALLADTFDLTLHASGESCRWAGPWRLAGLACLQQPSSADPAAAPSARTPSTQRPARAGPPCSPPLALGTPALVGCSWGPAANTASIHRRPTPVPRLMPQPPWPAPPNGTMAVSSNTPRLLSSLLRPPSTGPSNTPATTTSSVLLAARAGVQHEAPHAWALVKAAIEARVALTALPSPPEPTTFPSSHGSALPSIHPHHRMPHTHHHCPGGLGTGLPTTPSRSCMESRPEAAPALLPWPWLLGPLTAPPCT
jgi:hypothetical protein